MEGEDQVMTWLSQLLSAMGRPFMWWVVIATWEMGVRVRLGKTARELRPGFHLRIPFVDRVYVQTTRTRTITSTGLTVTTRDRKNLTVSLAVEYSLSSMLLLYETMANPDTILRCRIERAIVEFASRMAPEDLTPDCLNDELSEFCAGMRLEQCGFREVKAFLTSCAVVRAIRLMSNDYVSNTSLYNLDDPNAAGERK